MGRSHLRVIRSLEEEAFIEPPSTSDKQAAKTNHATWKFELLATVAGDPLADPFCVVVVLAYSHFSGPEERTAYLSENELKVRTGVVPRALSRAKKRLVELGYLTPAGKTAAGIIIYRLDNPRRDLVAEHRVFATETMKEKDAFRRDEERRRRRMRECSSAAPTDGARGAHQHHTGDAHQHPNSVDATVEERGIDAEDSNTGGLGAYVRERWAVPDEGWPPLSTEERA